MNMGQVKVAVGLDVRLVSGIINYLFQTEAIERDLALDLPGTSGQLDSLTLATEIIDGDTLMVLQVAGRIIVENMDDTEFSARLSLVPFVRAVADAAPVAALEVGELISADPALLALAFPTIRDNLNTQLQDLAIPLFDPLIEQIETAFFGNNPPPRSDWAAAFRLTPAATLDRVNVGFPAGQPDMPFVQSRIPMATVPSLVATIALPGENPVPVDTGSIVPVPTGIQVIISKDTMNAMLALETASQVGQTIEDATINALSMEMTDLGIKLQGSAESGPADIDWDGTLLIYFSKLYRRRGSPALRWMDGRVNVFSSGIDVDVDLPWWVTMLRVGLFLLGPIGWVLDATLVQPKLDEADEAPGLIRGAFRAQVTDALQAAIANVADIEAGDAPLMVFGHDAWVLDGHYATSLIAFAGRNLHAVTAVEHDEFEIEGAHGQSVGLLTLDSGHVLHPEEMGRLLISGIIDSPGLHGVHAPYGYYVRSNPNDTGDDNLVDPDEIHMDEA